MTPTETYAVRKYTVAITHSPQYTHITQVRETLNTIPEGLSQFNEVHSTPVNGNSGSK